MSENASTSWELTGTDQVHATFRSSPAHPVPLSRYPPWQTWKKSQRIRKLPHIAMMHIDGFPFGFAAEELKAAIRHTGTRETVRVKRTA